ncbi:uncharacterized protein PHALS_04054 [Plasmopara halstedii]|uniref:Uncharacterized protein n=1 Tax=Plasmopara halstedii TaxID=4781 RepID=A0A0N7L3T8_PLAHL|nr:uncharacterized protein PHALS_04054 [Plasmopara halstedii]CEG36795.1 hypothetical protein PHALS_04054 [Plasmopara halstedii]|eukprot:XP_024573164.1 hypothetical protein PHALS_04054 [Plasmopara halstedii]
MDDDGGPQAERSRRLQAQGRLQIQDQSQPQVHPLAHVKSATGPSPCVSGCCLESARLTDERDFLRSYSERLLVQLRGILQRHGESDRIRNLAEVTESNNEPHERLAPWLTASDYMNPLLQAYDLKIQELKTALLDSKKALDRVTTRAEEYVKENTKLKEELGGAGEKMLLRMQNYPKGMQLDEMMQVQENGDFLQEMNERIDVLMAENNMLMEQVSLQDNELGAMKTELTDKDQQLQSIGQNLNEATQALLEVRDACTHIREEKLHCERQLQRYAASVAQLESAKETLTTKIDTARRERSELESKLEECTDLIEKMKRGSECKDEAFSTRYQNVCVRLRELTDALDTKDKAIDELKERNSDLQSELDAVRQDCEGILNVLNSMEKQLTQYSAREEAVAELEVKCKTKAEEAILEKEEVAARELQSRREIARLLERLRQQAADYVKLKDESLSTLARKHETVMSSREQEIKTLNAELVALRLKIEVAVRSQKDLDRKLADSVRLSKDAGISFENKLRHLSERVATAEEARDTLSQMEVEYLERIRAKDDALSKLRAETRERGQELSERVASLERELQMRRLEAREAKDESEEQHRKVQLLNDQLNKVKADCANRFSSEFEILHQQNQDLKAQTAELEYKLSLAKKEAASVVSNTRSERERSEVRLVAEIESLKERLQSLKEERKRADKCQQETDSRCSVLSLQVQQLSRELDDAKDLLIEQEQACEYSDRKVSELSAQLTAALSKQQQCYRQERDLRTALERMTLERARMEREITLGTKSTNSAIVAIPFFHCHINGCNPKRSKEKDFQIKLFEMGKQIVLRE